MVQQAAKSPVPQATPAPAAGAPAAANSAGLGRLSYAQARAAVAPGGGGGAADPLALDYAAGRAAVAPAADSAAAEKLRAAAARASYQALLGAALGGKLYDLVAAELAPDKILALGGQGLDAAAAAGVAAIKPVAGAQIMDEASEADAVKQFAGALANWAKGEAETWLKSADGKDFAAKVSQWFEGNPAAVVGLALLAAAGAVAGNASIPELQQKFQLGANTTLNAGVNLNRLRDIAVKSAQLGVAWKKADATASLTYAYKKGESGQADTQTLSVKVGDTHKSLTADATVQGDKLVVKTAGEYKGDGLTVAAGVQQTRQSGSNPATLADAKVTVGSATENVTAEAKYDVGSGDLAIDVGALRKFAAGPDGLSGDVHGTTGYDGKAGASVTAGATLQTPADLKIALDAALHEHGPSTVAGSAQEQVGDFTAKESATFDLTDDRLQQLALEFGFRDKNSFDAFVVDYKRTYSGDVPSQELDLLVQAQLGKLMVRAQSKTMFQRDALRGNVTDVQAAYPVSSDVTLIGGARYGYDDSQNPGGLSNHERGAWLEAGVQFKGVPIVVGYRPEDNAVTVGITLAFGK